MEMKQRVEYLDYAKGILVLTVIVGHVFQDTFISKFIYNFHMMAFFLISGIQFNYSTTMNKHMCEIILSRMRSMMIPFCFFEAWGCVTYIIRFGFNQNIKGFLYNTLTLNFNNGVLWFLFTLFVAELVFMALMKVSTNKATIFGIAVISLALSLVLPTNHNYLDYFVRILRALFFVICGYYSIDIVENSRNVIAVGYFALLIGLTRWNGCIGFTDVTVRNIVLFLMGSFAGTLMTIQLAKNIRSKILRYIGQNTLTIFATHNCYYMLFGDMLKVSDFRSITAEKGMLVILLVIMAEIPTVYLLNKYFPVVVGKCRRK